MRGPFSQFLPPRRKRGEGQGGALAFVFALTVLMSGTGNPARAQTEPCSANTGNEQGVACIEPADSDRDIVIRRDGAEISTTADGDDGHGVQASTEGTGAIYIRIRSSTVTTTGDGGRGIHARRANGAGDIEIDVAGSTVSTSGGTSGGKTAYGIYGEHQGADGDLVIVVRDGSKVLTFGSGARGIDAWRTKGVGDVVVVVRDGSRVATEGSRANGIIASRDNGDGHIDIDIAGSSVATLGRSANGIYAFRSGGEGHIDIDIVGSSIATSGSFARGVYAWHRSDGDIDILLERSSVTTGDPSADGLYGLHGGAGDIVIVVRGSAIMTSGRAAEGIHGRHAGSDGDILISVGDGSTVTASGDAAHGIRADGRGDGAVHILVRNAAVRASGAGSDGIRVRDGGLDADGNRKLAVTVDGEVWGGSGDGAGIRLIGGGRVVIGPHGRVGADSGVAIRVTRADSSDQTESPRLFVDLRPEGRPLDLERFLAGEISNDDGTTELAVNGVTVFSNPMPGAMNVWVPNGAWDVRATGTDLSTLAFIQRFAPRAAVYKALPGVLLRLDEAGGPGGGMGGPWGGDAALLRSTGTPVWARIAGGMGSYEAENATAGARYDYDRYGVESGVDFRLGHGLTGWAGVRVVSGSADVSAPTGGGRIEARGYGVTAGLAWEGEDGLYGAGRLSLTRYTADLVSETRGGLKSGVTGTVHALDLEGGRRFGLDLLGRKTRLTARGLLRRSGVSLGEFDDGLFSTVSVEKADRLAAGAGVAAETGLLPSDGVDRLRLRGSLDAEQVLSGGTKVDVSGTALESKAGGTRLGAGFGAAYRMAGYTIGGAVGAGGLGSGDTSWSARLDARIAF